MNIRFLSYLPLEEYQDISNKIYKNLKHVKSQYVGFDSWFSKVLKEVDGKVREIIFVEEDNNILGFIILKNTLEEKKICGIFVKEEYRNKGIGSILIEKGIKFLKEEKPIITISLEKVDMFKSFIKKYNWVQTSVFNGYNYPEAIFNEKEGMT